MMPRVPKIVRVNKGDGTLYGWQFQCPGCEDLHTIGTAWAFNGDVYFPTFSPSILVQSKRGTHRCHSFIRSGRIQFLPDCKHHLANQTVPLGDLPSWLTKRTS